MTHDQVTTFALESFVKAINDQGNMRAEIVTNVIIGDTHYSEVNYTMLKPVEIIIIDYEVMNDQKHFGS
jgi:hypothetical protein